MALITKIDGARQDVDRVHPFAWRDALIYSQILRNTCERGTDCSYLNFDYSSFKNLNRIISPRRHRRPVLLAHVLNGNLRNWFVSTMTIHCINKNIILEKSPKILTD